MRSSLNPERNPEIMVSAESPKHKCSRPASRLANMVCLPPSAPHADHAASHTWALMISLTPMHACMSYAPILMHAP